MSIPTNISFKKHLVARISLRLLSLVMIFLAFLGISWGTYLEPVSKNGSSVSFVFDISNSMTAKDCQNQLSRLNAAGIYAKKLLKNMDGASVSVVLAKGDGIAAIPLTQDYAMIESLIDALSPGLMTAPGTSIGKGILKAVETFPKSYNSAGQIWVFTDGEETDSHLKQALSECVRLGIPVSLIGFGSETESQVLAGDGKTVINTALRADRLQSTIEGIKAGKGYKGQAEIQFVKADERASAARLLSGLRSDGEQLIAYETKPVPRFKLFLILSVIFLILSYVVAEFDFSRLGLLKKSQTLMLLCLCAVLTGCSSRSMKILEGSYKFNQDQYDKAISLFLQAAEAARDSDDQDDLNFSLYDLGTSYLMLNEDSAALEKFSGISEDAPQAVRYAAFYNAGIIASRNEDFTAAREYFRKALEADSTKIQAKINLELSIQGSEIEGKKNESRAIPASENNSQSEDLERAIFERIKENDKNKWKNSESNQNSNLAEDY